MKAVAGLLLLVCLVHLASASMPVLSGKSSLRFGEITAENIADNSISTSKLQAYAVGAAQLAGGAVDANKIASEAIYAPHFSPNSVTSRSLAVDTVTIHIDGQDPIESTRMGGRSIPVGPESVQPSEGVDDGDVIIDSPDVSRAYVVEGKARGPGVILGWYPAQNGHLLRYQHARSLQGLVCADVGMEDMDISFPCTCSCNSGDGGFINDVFNGNDNDCSCSCGVTKNFRNANWDRDLGNPAGGNACDVVCTSLADGYPAAGRCTDPNAVDIQDPACLSQINAPDTAIVDNDLSDLDNFNDFYGDRTDPFSGINTNQPNQPEACSAYTSVEDVNNPQEGISNYAPSVESIEIDQEGRIFLTFFGYGENDRRNPATTAGYDFPDIDIVVVVLLDEQFGA